MGVLLLPRIFGCLWILCLLSPEIQGLCTKPDLSDNVLSNSSNADFTEGSSLRLSCVLGYQPASGRRTVTCQDGGWVPEPKDFTCKKKPCENPGEVKNGRYEIPEGLDFGDVITPVCNKGYYLAGQGDGSRTCSADGTWTGQEPFCEVVKCSSPPPIENGHVESAPEEEYQYDDLVIYACNTDYTLFGNRESRCSVSEANGNQRGTWTEQPTCKKVECQKPDVPDATLTGSGGSGPYKYKAVLTYKCNEGFHLVSGEARIVCEVNGWSSIPKCEAKQPLPKTTPRTSVKETTTSKVIHSSAKTTPKSSAEATTTPKGGGKNENNGTGSSHVYSSLWIVLAAVVGIGAVLCFCYKRKRHGRSRTPQII